MKGKEQKLRKGWPTRLILADSSRSAFLAPRCQAAIEFMRVFAMTILGALSAVFTLSGAPARERSPDSVIIEVSSIPMANSGQNHYLFHYRIRNNDEQPVFCARLAGEKPNVIESLEIEMQKNGQTWKALPRHHEIPPWISSPVKIGPGQVYESEFTLDRTYYVSEWAAYPKKSYTIILDGKLRIALNYSLGENEWNAYVADQKARLNSPAGSPRAVNIVARRLAYSEPFMLSSTPSKPQANGRGAQH